MSEWKLKSLKDLSVSITSGLTPLKSNLEYWDNPVIPWLKTDQLGEKYIWDTNTKISEIALEKTSLKLYPPKTLSIAMYGEGKTRGNISIIMKPMATNQACCNIIINEEKADFEYVYYYLKTQYESLRSLSSGVRNNLNANDIKNYEIRIPESLVEQSNISKILSVLDQKITLNNQINEELEAMAKTLYDYWFVQFDFPDENGNPYKSSGGKMVYNDQLKREIPEGWGVQNIFDVATVQYGYPFSSDAINDSELGIPIVRIRDILQNTISGYSTEEVDDRYKIEEGEILIGMDGNFHINYWTLPGCYINQRVLKINSNILSNIIIHYQIAPYIQLREKSVSRTTVGHLSDKDIKSLLIVTPSDDLLENINNIFDQILPLTIKNKQQNQELTQLRDWLLPMLMNGQVKVE
ncbi:restriction endonuclease subunit S [Streptococcus suis]